MKHGIHPSLVSLAVPLADLKPDPMNARLHSKRNIAEVVTSYKEHGQRKPIVVQKRTTETGATEFVVRAGNGQCEAARELGWTHIAAVVVEEGDRDAVKFAIRDNRTAELAEWDWHVLAQEDAAFANAGGLGLTELGWSEAEVLPLRQTSWFMEATGQLEDHSREKPGDDKDKDDGKKKQEVTIVGEDAVSFIEAAALMRERFGEPGMNLGHVVGRLARHYLATLNHSKSPTN